MKVIELVRALFTRQAAAKLNMGVPMPNQSGSPSNCEQSNGESPSLSRQQEVQTVRGKVYRPSIYIKKLVFNNGESLETEKGDIVVFVGPNNVGKSQLLKDIYSLAGNGVNPTVLNDIVCCKPSLNSILQWYDHHLTHTTTKYGRVYYGYTLGDVRETDLLFGDERKFGALRNLAMHCLNTDSRLFISNPVEGLTRSDPPQSPIHALTRDAVLLKKVSDYVKKAFGTSVAPIMGKVIPLCVGPDIEKGEVQGETMSEIEANYLKRLDSYPQLQDQGDGMRSFVGMIMWFLLEHYNIFLVDEPETFLHPPQATLIGGIVGELISEERQAFIATHSIHFINGLLEKVPSRVKIVRVTRTGNTNTFSILDNASIRQISKDPFLKYSSLLEGMFYKSVVLCESDADCMFYSMVNGSADMKGERGADTLFTHCGGKQRMPKVLGALNRLNVEVRVVADFDVLNNESLLQELVQVRGGNWNRIKKEYGILISDIRQRSHSGTTGAEVLKNIQAELIDVMDKVVTQTKIRSLREMLTSDTEWDRLKKAGINGIGAGNPRQACGTVLNYLKTLGIHVVPCGELECFVPTVGGHGPDWIHSVIEQHPDTSSSVYTSAKEFVREWHL